MSPQQPWRHQEQGEESDARANEHIYRGPGRASTRVTHFSISWIIGIVDHRQWRPPRQSFIRERRIKDFVPRLTGLRDEAQDWLVHDAAWIPPKACGRRRHISSLLQPSVTGIAQQRCCGCVGKEKTHRAKNRVRDDHQTGATSPFSQGDRNPLQAERERSQRNDHRSHDYT